MPLVAAAVTDSLRTDESFSGQHYLLGLPG
jgi:hypothetical protein